MSLYKLHCVFLYGDNFYVNNKTINLITQISLQNEVGINKVYNYDYDVLGNISKTRTYNYTVSTLGAPLQTNSYGYDSAYKDLLVSYNNNAITYDQAGNPLNYYNGMTFEWQMGRELSKITHGTKNYTYTYNEAGIRTKQVAPGSAT